MGFLYIIPLSGKHNVFNSTLGERLQLTAQNLLQTLLVGFFPSLNECNSKIINRNVFRDSKGVCVSTVLWMVIMVEK